MLRRAFASLVLATLVAQTSVSLYACHRMPTVAAAATSASAVHHRSHDDHATATADDRLAAPDADRQSIPGHVCNRHERGRCPHARGAALSPCTSDPTAGLAAATDSGLPSLAAVTLVRASTILLDPTVRSAPPGGAAPLPELPPPQA